MRTLASIAFGLPLAALTPPNSPLGPLVTIADGIDGGLAAFLRGDGPSEAFHPWVSDEMTPEKAKALRDALTEKGVTSAECFSFELVLQYWKGNEPVYEIRGLARVPSEAAAKRERASAGDPPPPPKPGEPPPGNWIAGPGFPAFVAFEGSPIRDASELHGKGLPLAKFLRHSKPFADAARSVADSMRGADGSVPFVHEDVVRRCVAPKWTKAYVDALERSKTNLATVRAELAALGDVEVRVRIEEQRSVARDKDGKLVPGWIRGKFDLDETGALRYRLSRFETK